ncbi:MAG: ATP-binding protein [Bacteroidetes bacterium]|nr:ATP-binding protein [Bacteroidota bacterium]
MVLNWSSGKDAALAYYLLNNDNRYQVTNLLTTINAEHERVFMHGLREQMLDMQAERMGLPLTKVKLPPSPDDNLYKNAMRQTLEQFKEKEGITTAAFGDIFLEDLKAYREAQLATIGFQGLFPVWKKNTSDLITLIEETGIEAVTVCISEKYLGKEMLGRKIDRSFLNDLPPNVDPCGENGEFHTFVYNAPYFSTPIPIIKGETVYKNYAPTGDKDNNTWDTGFYFLDILPG